MFRYFTFTDLNDNHYYVDLRAVCRYTLTAMHNVRFFSSCINNHIVVEFYNVFDGTQNCKCKKFQKVYSVKNFCLTSFCDFDLYMPYYHLLSIDF